MNRQTPITVEDVLNSRMITYPFRLLQPAFPGWYRILRCNGSDYRIGYNMLSGIERGSHGGPGG
jgi:hypothetical protein